MKEPFPEPWLLVAMMTFSYGPNFSHMHWKRHTCEPIKCLQSQSISLAGVALAGQCVLYPTRSWLDAIKPGQVTYVLLPYAPSEIYPSLFHSQLNNCAFTQH